MLAFFLIILWLVVIIAWLVLRDRINAVDSNLRWSNQQEKRELEEKIAELTKRVLKLERQQREATIPPSAPQIIPQTPEKIVPPPPLVPAPVPEAPPPRPRLEYKPAPAYVPASMRTTAPAGPAWPERLRKLRGDREWETLVAGSWLNKIGALVLVIGIALFLGYSFKMVNPAGRAATALLISTAILIGGVVLERREQYRVFSRGLIGAGWAALYTTAYAIYALPAAQLISNPFAGSVVLLAVSAGMIAHSLLYRSQVVTALAYFTAFAALAVTPSAPFAVAGLIPLAASLLYFAWRFEWYTSAFFGLAATYATRISRGSSNAPLYASTSLFVTYWIVFELFDILRSRRGSKAAGLTWIFPLNAIAFFGLTYQTWSKHAPQQMWRIAALSAFLFFASAMLRMLFRPPNNEAAETDPFDCIRRGTYEAPLTVSAVLAALAILGRITGFWTNIAIAFEAEILFLAGVRFHSTFLRTLGRFAFIVSQADLFFSSLKNEGSVLIFGASLHNWTPSALVYVVLFYLNRVIWRAAIGFSFAATALISLVCLSEFTPHWAPIGLFVLALVLFEFGIRKKLVDIRIQSYLVALAAIISTVRAGQFIPYAPVSLWVLPATAAFACWLFSARTILVSANAIGQEQITILRGLFAAFGSGFALLTLWMAVPGTSTAATWTGFALLLFAIDSLFNLNAFAWIAVGVLGAAYVRLLAVNLTAWSAQKPAERWLIPLFVIAALYWLWHAFRKAADTQKQMFAPLFTWLAAFGTVCFLYLETGRLYTVSAWAALALVFLIAGLKWKIGTLRAQSYCLFAAAALSCIFINFAQSGGTEMFARILGASLLIALLYTAEFLLPKDMDAIERRARAFFSISATLLLTGLLFHEVSGRLLTVAWSLEALACLGGGFPARERILRLQGLALFALCTLKLFLYDLRNLETIYRILSFVALGVILLGVSWVYTRFRVQIQRYL